MRKNILILGTVKNCSKTIVREIGRLEKAFSDFNRQYFLVESDSIDDSLIRLNYLSEKYNYFSFHSAGKLSRSIPVRVERITFCRNIYLDFLEEEVRIKTFDYVAVVDFDNVNSKLNKKSVLSIFNFTGWTACAVNQLGPYYDIYALRAKGWNNRDINLELKQSITDSVGAARRFRDVVISKMFYKRGNDPILVDSAFGGCVIYKTEGLLGHRYSARDSEGNLQCEHVGLHESMKSDGARIFIVPSFINANWTANAKRAVIKYLLLLIFKGRYYKLRNEFVS